ncbi:OmpA family protein [Candidatus Sumerlaeota bacterium]|nr:OmpA family protein [Candidatus Sumerlaeota bacterium]
MIGLATGGLAGALAGNLMDMKQKKELEKELENLKKELELKSKLLADKDKEIADLKARIKELEDKLRRQEQEIARLRKQLAAQKPQPQPEIIATLMVGPHFSPGKDELTREGMKELDRVARILKEKYVGREVSLRGHCDSDPIKYSNWPSNWELGAYRAVRALRYLQEKHGFKGEQLSGTTYSYYRPVGSNSTKEGKASNRRVEIVVLPEVKPKVQTVK